MKVKIQRYDTTLYEKLQHEYVGHQLPRLLCSTCGSGAKSSSIEEVGRINVVTYAKLASH